MTGNLNRHRKYGLPAISALAAAMLMTGLLGGPALADTGTDAGGFDEQFEPFETLPPTPEPAPDVVDITDIEPPLEVEDAPDTRPFGTGEASYYGRRFHGRRTANGERFNMNELTAAHKTLPFGTHVLVTNPRNGKSVTVRINDRGPYAHGRMIDLSRAAASRIGLVSRGHGQVQLAIVE